MIKLKNIRYATVSASRSLDKFEQQQLARLIEKYILSNYSVVCDVEVK